MSDDPQCLTDSEQIGMLRLQVKALTDLADEARREATINLLWLLASLALNILAGCVLFSKL